MTELPEFDFLQRNIAWLKDRQDRKEISLNYAFRKAQRKEDDDFRNAMREEREELGDNKYTMQEILLDVSVDKESQRQAKLQNSILPNGQSKSNTYYQKVFYYQPENSGKITQVWVEQLDYEKAVKNSEEITALLSRESGIELDHETVKEMLKYFKNADSGSDFLVEKEFARRFEGVLDDKQIDQLLPAFFSRLIELDPRVLDDRPTLDIPLRESLRVLADWLDYNEEAAKNAALAAAKVEDDRMRETPAATPKN